MIAAAQAVTESPPSGSDEAIFDARDLEVVFATKHGYTRALNNVSIRVLPGEAIGVIGESGSGKTTLTRSLLGLVPPRLGHVLHRGHNIYTMKHAPRFRTLSQDAALVFQDPRGSLNPRLSVGAVVRDPLTVLRIGGRRDRKDRVYEVLESVGLPAEMAGRPVRALSGGQLQRVALARALVVNPSVIIADEPTSALDVSVEAQILNLLQSLRAERQLAVLIVSHDIRVVHFLTDRTVVMYNGEIVEQGPTREIYSNPHHDYTKSLLDAAPRLDFS